MFFKSLRDMFREQNLLRREIAQAKELIVVQDRAFDRQQRKLGRMIDVNLALREELDDVKDRLRKMVREEAV